LENDFTAATLLRSEPYTVKLDRAEPYKPQNFQNKYANAPITLAQALAVSDNIYAIKTQEIIGVEQVIKTARDFGLEQTMDATPSLALGTAAIPLVEMVTAYSHIANGGKQVHPHMIQSIK